MEMIKVVLTLVLFAFFFGCENGGENDNGNSINTCFSQASSDPCFDANTGGSVITVMDRSIEEVETELRDMDEFLGEPEMTNVFTDAIDFDGLDFECSSAFDQSALLIREEEDWNRLRDSCLFSRFTLPDIDFSDQMALVSIYLDRGFITDINSAFSLTTGTSVVVDIKLPESILFFEFILSFHIVSVPKSSLPVDFIEVLECLPVEHVDFGRSECLAGDVIRVCQGGWFCTFGAGGSETELLIPGDCTAALDCNTLQCEQGVVSNLQIEVLELFGTINTGRDEQELSCSLILP